MLERRPRTRLCGRTFSASFLQFEQRLRPYSMKMSLPSRCAARLADANEWYQRRVPWSLK